MIELSKSCNHLIAIDISRCLTLTERGIMALIENKPELLRLNLENNNKDVINDYCLSGIKNCSKLTELNIN